MLELMGLLLYPLIGVFSGLLAGLLGVGGGIVMVPSLLLVFHLNDVDSPALMQIAVGTSLGAMVLSSLSSVRAHHQRGAVDWSLFRRMTPGIVLGTVLGSVLADRIDSQSLQGVFAVFLLLTSIHMLRAPRQNQDPGGSLPGWKGLSAIATLVGALSALLGIGGGSMNVPFLSHCGIETRRAIASAAAIGLPIALFGAATFAATGTLRTDLPAYSIGYLYLPALLGITVVAILTAPLGARLAHSWPTARLKRAFSAFLFIVALHMGYSAYFI